MTTPDAATWAKELEKIRERHWLAEDSHRMGGYYDGTQAHADRAVLLDYITLHARAVAAVEKQLSWHEDALNYLRYEWSRFNAKMCPACIYEQGTFIRHCKLHEALNEAEQRVAQAVRALEQAERALVGLSRGQNGKCWDRYGCHDGDHDDLCLMAQTILLRARGPQEGA